VSLGISNSFIVHFPFAENTYISAHKHARTHTRQLHDRIFSNHQQLSLSDPIERH